MAVTAMELRSTLSSSASAVVKLSRYEEFAWMVPISRSVVKFAVT